MNARMCGFIDVHNVDYVRGDMNGVIWIGAIMHLMCVCVCIIYGMDFLEHKVSMNYVSVCKLCSRTKPMDAGGSIRKTINNSYCVKCGDDCNMML